jgi:hypothetical protein
MLFFLHGNLAYLLGVRLAYFLSGFGGCVRAAATTRQQANGAGKSRD